MNYESWSKEALIERFATFLPSLGIDGSVDTLKAL